MQNSYRLTGTLAAEEVMVLVQQYDTERTEWTNERQTRGVACMCRTVLCLDCCSSMEILHSWIWQVSTAFCNLGR